MTIRCIFWKSCHRKTNDQEIFLALPQYPSQNLTEPSYQICVIHLNYGIYSKRHHSSIWKKKTHCTLTYWFSSTLRPLILNMHAWVSNSIPSTAMVKVVLTLLLLTEPVIDSFWTRLIEQKKKKTKKYSNYQIT